MITKENNAILMSYIGDTDMAAPPSEGNPSAWIIFLRDVTRICEYFSLQGVESPPRKLATDLWTAHGHKIIKQVDPLLMDAENLEDR